MFWIGRSIAGLVMFGVGMTVYRRTIKKIEQEIREGEALGLDMSNRHAYLAHFRTITSL